MSFLGRKIIFKKQIYVKKTKGFLLVEIILSISLFALVILGVITGILYAQKSQVNAGANNRATAVAEDSLEIIRNLRSTIFSATAPDCSLNSPCGLSKNSVTGAWSFVTGGVGDDISGFHRIISFPRDISVGCPGRTNIDVTIKIWPNGVDKDPISVISNLDNWNPVYALRDYAPDCAGFVFYVDPPGAKLLPVGKTYLEAAPSDQAENQVFSDALVPVLDVTTGTAIGTGQANTTSILTQVGQTNSAAKICDDLVLDGHSDWFLPSKDELNKMWLNLKSGTDENSLTYNPVGNFSNNDYWSSSVYPDGGAWSQTFNGGPQGSASNNAHYLVRCIRAF